MLYFLLDLITLGLLNATLVLGLNLQYGFGGILNFSYYTFVAIGAYVTAVMTMGHPASYDGLERYILQWSLPWPIAVIIGGIAAGCVGIVVFAIAFRRLRSDYFAIVTIAAGFVIWNAINNFVPLFNGANGLVNIPAIANLSSTKYTALVGLISLGIFVATYVMIRRLFHSPFGRVLRSLREDEILAESLGKKVLRTRLVAATIGCTIAGIVGGIFVLYISAWSPAAFLPLETFVIFAALIIGGTGNYNGSILGAFLVIDGLVELPRLLPGNLGVQFAGPGRAILLGVAIILFLRFRPSGILPEKRLYGRTEHVR